MEHVNDWVGRAHAKLPAEDTCCTYPCPVTHTYFVVTLLVRPAEMTLDAGTVAP